MQNVAYVTSHNPRDPGAYGGAIFHMIEALRRESLNVIPIGPLYEEGVSWQKARQLIYREVLRQKHRRDREPRILKGYARQVERALRDVDADVIMSPSTLPIAYLNDDRPIVLWCDATFPALLDYYPDFVGLSRRTIRNGMAVERVAVNRCALAIYTSSWAASSAVNDLGVDPSKVRVVPYGAMLSQVDSRETVRRHIRARSTSVCRLLFVGVDWIRKGGPKAVSVAGWLNDQGIQTELVVVGCQPGAPLPPFVRVIGFLNKSAPDENRRLLELMYSAHFLVLTSIADCTPNVVYEASAAGLPISSHRTGGIPSILEDDKNGKLFAPESSADEMAEWIASVFRRRDRYEELAISTYEEYSSRLNWAASGHAVARLLSQTSQ